MQVVAYRAEHARSLNVQEAQHYELGLIQEPYITSLEQYGGLSYSLLDGETVMGCAGVIPMWSDRGIAWALLSSGLKGSKFMYAHGAAKRFLDICPLRRIETTVDCSFEAGHKWVKLLGFELEAERMRSYRPDGGDHALYARVRT